MKKNHARSSRARLGDFVAAYRRRQLDDPDAPVTPPPDTAPQAAGPGRAARRESLREYGRWLWPHRAAVAGVFVLALAVAGLQMVEPLFMRFIVDRVLLNEALDAAARTRQLQTAGAAFLGVILLSSVLGLFKDYRQRQLNVRVMLELRRSLFERLLHLPLPRLWDMKTGGILSRLTGDVDTTTGLLQMAAISPAISVLRLAIAIGILLTLNWRLALTAIAVIPGAMVIS